MNKRRGWVTDLIGRWILSPGCPAPEVEWRAGLHQTTRHSQSSRQGFSTKVHASSCFAQNVQTTVAGTLRSMVGNIDLSEESGRGWRGVA